MRLSLPLQRCHPGRNVRMLPKEATTAEVGMEVGGAVTTSTPKVVEGDMREEGEEGTREAEGEEQEGATNRVVEEEEEAMAEEATRATFRTPDTTAVEVTTTTTTRTEAGIMRGVGVEEPGEQEDVVVEEAEEAGEEEGGRIQTKVDSLNSSFNMVASSTARLALTSPGITQASETKIFILKGFNISSRRVQMLLLRFSTSQILRISVFPPCWPR